MGTLELGKKERPRGIMGSRGALQQMRNLDFNLQVEKQQCRILGRDKMRKMTDEGNYFGCLKGPFYENSVR